MFAHLHNHTAGSYSDSIVRIEEGVRKAADLGLHAAAITDHGDLSFIVEFHNSCRRCGVKPILGCECYFVEDAQKSIEEKNPYRNHLVLLAKDNEGLRNLIALNNASWLQNCYYGQRGLTDWRLLEKYHAGLIAMTGCYWGMVSRKFVRDGIEEARTVYARLYDIFGEDLYPEIGRHGVADEELSNEVLQKLAVIFGSRPVLTNDVHYLRQEDWIIHDILIKTRFGFASNFKVDAQNFYLKSAEQMARLGFPRSYMETTLEISEKCTVDLESFAWERPSGDGDRYVWAPRLDTIDAREAIEAPASVMKVNVEDLLAALPPGQTIEAALEAAPAFRKRAEALPAVMECALVLEGLARRAEPDPGWAVKVNVDPAIPVRMSHGVLTAQFMRETLGAIGMEVERAETVPALLATSKKIRARVSAAGLMRRKKYREARDELLELYNREPENIDYAYRIGNTYYFEGSYSHAAQWFKDALALKGSRAIYPEISVRLAWCCRRLGDKEGAIKWFRAALDRNRGYPQALYGIGLAHFFDNEYAEARKYLNNFLDTAPTKTKREKAEKILSTIERRTQGSN